MKSRFDGDLRRQLALEYNCAPEDFDREESVLTVSRLRQGRRMYSSRQYFFQMVTLGGNAVITADEYLHPFLRRFLSDRAGFWLFEIPNLLPLEEELNRFGYTLTDAHHMFLPVYDTPVGQPDYPIRYFYGEDIFPLYGEAFPNALCPRFQPERPDRIALCAMDGERIMGMAGCSEDAPGWLQIGVDVRPPYRSKGIGTHLVTLLKNEILARRQIPFYGTGTANYHSRCVALNAGFRPAWVEIGAKRREIGDEE